MKKLFANYYGAIAAITALKMLLLLSLNYSGHVMAFVGDNAKDHYVPIAERLISEGRFIRAASRPDSKVPPGYSVVLAAVKIAAKHAGFNYLLGICCVQMLADFAVSVLLSRLGRVVASQSAGRLAGLVWQLYPAAVVVFSCWITAETIFTLLALLSFTFLTESIQRPTSSQTWIAGVARGLVTMFRATCLGAERQRIA
jgi:Gpi18-like mannosyltransferase